jgi:twitching motility protein PilT
MDINTLLKVAVAKNASDLHLSAGMPPILRVDGELQRLDQPILLQEETRVLICSTMNSQQIAMYEKTLEIDYAYELPKLGRFRVNAFNQLRGVGATFRAIPQNVLSLEELSAPKIFKEMITHPRGIILVTGPTGSGKSTTLAAMIDFINKHRTHHIITIEDPIEFVHLSQKSLINQREVFQHTLGFSEALRSALREDPDVILLGEMRDLATIRLALTAAETGHLVFATVHTASAAKTIDRIIDVFPAEEKNMVRGMLSESLRAVVTQTLVKKIEGGRIACHEIMVCNSAIRNLIREGKVSQMYSAIQTGRAQGMQTMDQALQELVKQRVITKEEARSKAEHKEAFN